MGEKFSSCSLSTATGRSLACAKRTLAVFPPNQLFGLMKMNVTFPASVAITQGATHVRSDETPFRTVKEKWDMWGAPSPSPPFPTVKNQLPFLFLDDTEIFLDEFPIERVVREKAEFHVHIFALLNDTPPRTEWKGEGQDRKNSFSTQSR